MVEQSKDTFGNSILFFSLIFIYLKKGPVSDPANPPFACEIEYPSPFKKQLKDYNCLIERVLDPAHSPNLIICSFAQGCQKSVLRCPRHPADRQTD